MNSEAELRSLGRRMEEAAHRSEQKRVGKARQKASVEYQFQTLAIVMMAFNCFLP
jgi:hypothetical protein